MQTPDDLPLTCDQLAARLGVRFRGRPTLGKTVRGWMLDGLAGVRLESWLDPTRRVTTWRLYEGWRRKVAAAREARRERLRAACRPADRGARKRAEEARRANEAAGAR